VTQALAHEFKKGRAVFGEHRDSCFEEKEIQSNAERVFFSRGCVVVQASSLLMKSMQAGSLPPPISRGWRIIVAGDWIEHLDSRQAALRRGGSRACN